MNKYKNTTNPADITTRWLIILSECSSTFEHVPGSSNVLADYLSGCNFDNNQENFLTTPNLISETQSLPIVDCETPISLSPLSNTYHVNCLISGKHTNRYPLLEISNETFRNEQQNDLNLVTIYDHILQNGTSPSFPKYFIRPDFKVIMLKKDLINNSFSYHIVVPYSLESKVLTISHLSHFGLAKTYDFI